MEMGMNRRLARTISTECDTWFDNRHLVDISNEAKMTMLASEAWENLIGLRLSISTSRWRQPRIVSAGIFQRYDLKRDIDMLKLSRVVNVRLKPNFLSGTTLNARLDSLAWWSGED
jgi:hypothetical protein